MTTSREPPIAHMRLTSAEAVRDARALVETRLAGGPHAAVVADTQLVACELITNALLHAGPPVEFVLQPAGDALRVAVTDRSAAMPMRPALMDDSMTGRGIRLVEALARTWGVEPSGDSGKTVWAEIDANAVGERRTPDDALLRLWGTDDLENAPRPRNGEPRHRLQLGEVPTALLLAAKAHVDNLVREFTLASSGAATGATAAPPPHLAGLIETVVHRFAEVRHSVKQQALLAERSGRDRVRLELEVPVSVADTGREYLRALDEADAYCRAARLLTLESPPQHRLFRRWYVDEVVRQLERAAAGITPELGESFEQRLLSEIDSVAIAQRKSARATRLLALTSALTRALTVQAVASAVLEQGVAALGASGGGILLAARADTLAVPGTVGYEPDLVARLEAEHRNAELPAAFALRVGEPVWLESREERDRRFPQLVGLEPSTVSMCAVPLEVGDRRLGALRFSFSSGRLFDSDERDFVLALAAQTAQALDRAQMYSKRAEDTARLQQSLLPARITDVPGVDVDGTYLPLGDSMEIGGDFYDVWPCREGRFAVAIGDVCGNGPEAAGRSALARYTLRALALTENDPVAIMRDLDRALRETDPGGEGERFCTAQFGFLRHEGEALRLRLAAGGHPHPLIRRADGSITEVDLNGSLLGVFEDPDLAAVDLTLSPGDVLVLYTDGVLEARRADRFFGLEGLRESLQRHAGSGVPLSKAIVGDVLAHTGGIVQDDLAVLILRAH